jgi:hypothetical protein
MQWIRDLIRWLGSGGVPIEVEQPQDEVERRAIAEGDWPMLILLRPDLAGRHANPTVPDFL